MAYPLKEVMSSWTEETRDRSVMNGRRDMIHTRGCKLKLYFSTTITYIITYMAIYISLITAQPPRAKIILQLPHVINIADSSIIV